VIATLVAALGLLGAPPAASASSNDPAGRPGGAYVDVRADLRESARRRDARLAEIERIGLAREPRRCRKLVRRLEDAEPEVRSVAARSLGWCGAKDAVDPLIASLGRFGWDQAVEAALQRLDPSWRGRPAARRTFDEVHERWWKAVQEAGAAREASACEREDARPEADASYETVPCEEADAGPDPLDEWRAAALLASLDEARARAAILERLALPAGRYGCSLWAIEDQADAAFAEDLEHALAGAPDRECLQEAAVVLERLRPGWRKSAPARAAADVYAARVAAGPGSDAANACVALTILEDDRGRKCDRGGDGLEATVDRAREGAAKAIAVLKECASGADPYRSTSCVQALGALGREDLVGTYRAILAEPRPPAPEKDEAPRPTPAAEAAAGGVPAPAGSEVDADDEAASDQPTDEGDGEPHVQRYRWAERRAGAVTGLYAALGVAALDELRAIAADTEQPEEVLAAVVAAAKGRPGPEWTDLLLRVASRDDVEGAPGVALAALIDRGHLDALPLLWTRIQERSLGTWQVEELVASAARLAPEATTDRLRALAEGDPDLYPVLASAMLQPAVAASAQDLVGLLLRLAPEGGATAGPAGTRAAGSPGPASDAARSEARQAATDVLQRLADGPALDRSLAAAIAPLVDDSDPRVRALASYVLWRSERGR
jgi:hypothetical protein